MTDLDAYELGSRLAAETSPAEAHAAMRDLFGPSLKRLMYDPDPDISKQALELAVSLGVDTTPN